MNEIIPRTSIHIRVATARDVRFIDELQKRHRKMVGFLKMPAIEAKIAAGNVLVAEDATGEPLGYVMAEDRYFKREDVGIIFQLNVVPGHQRKLIGATLIKAVFERAAYGCRLFCCWCAQDIDANRFWRSVGFKALAYRAGSERKARVHVFWQARVRAGDTTTPWWYPSKTSGGSMGEERLALPIPPGKQWDDEMPVIVTPGAMNEKRKALPSPRKKTPKVPDLPRTAIARGGWKFSPPTAPKTEIVAAKPAVEREKKPKPKHDPKLVAAARELRDRWLEQVNAGAHVFEDAGKYDVSRALPEATARMVPLLPAA